MNNIKIQTNTFTKGMNCDLDYSLIDSSQYLYAENIRIIANKSNSTGVLQNIEGFLKSSLSQALSNESIIHVDTIRNWAIVFTKINNSTSNNIYRLDFTDNEDTPIVTKIVSSVELGIPSDTEISSVCRWESNEIVKIYWCDGVNQLRSLNVAKTYTSLNVDSLNILPKGILPPLLFKGLGYGSLKAGKYQYCYQLFNSRSSETNISILSPIISVSKDENQSNSEDVVGSKLKENTNKSINLQANLSNNSFSRAKIIKIYYFDNTSTPEISILDDIPVSGNIIIYEDKGNSSVDELTLDEFNALSNYMFAPKVIESKDNILFASNIKEITWDIEDSDYDTRAYRCNSSGQILLTSNSGQSDINFSVDDIATQEVPVEHDCICTYNEDNSSDYKYGKTSSNEYVLGGTGKNISYRFITSDLIEDSNTALEDGNISEDYELQSEAITSNTLELYGVNNSGTKTSIGQIQLPGGVKSRIINYSNSDIENALVGYCRDEIYRFAIVFYDDSNSKSSAHWIADIKIPQLQDPGFNTFTTGKQVNVGSTTTGNMQLVTHPLGIQFTIDNLPASVKAYEIVRCKRTLSDRSVLMQGVISKLINHDTFNNMLVALPYLTYNDKHGVVSRTSTYSYEWQFSSYASNEYFLFISPEICVNRNNAEEIVNKANYITRLCNLKSHIEPTIGDGTSNFSEGEGTKAKPFATAKEIKADGNALTPITSLDYNVDNGWTYQYVGANHTFENMIRMDGGDFYGTTLAKYYIYDASVGYSEASIDDIAIATETDPTNVVDDAWKVKSTNIGNKTYYNWMYDSKDTAVTEDANNLRKMGPHGVCAVFKSNNLILNMPSIIGGPEDANAVILCNLKQNITAYGGNSYSVRQNSTYISTGCCKILDGSDIYVSNCFGGDTYLGVLDYANGMFSYDPKEYNDYRTNRIYNGAYFPVESSINLSLRSDSCQTSRTYDKSTGYSNHFVQNNIIQIIDLYTQNEPLYAYNDAFSAQATTNLFVSKSIYDIDNAVTDFRILNSESKTNNEVIDSWTKFKVANYIDTDSKYGAINNMKVFKNLLFFWQDNALGIASVNERSLIQDNNIGLLTLGTGGILARIDYVSIENGSKAGQLHNIVSTNNSMYWYDANKNEICEYDSNLKSASKTKGVQTYLNSNLLDITNHPKVAYDSKYNEVLFTLANSTLVFNEELGAFTAIYKINPTFYVEFTNKLYTFNNLDLYRYNAGDNLNLYDDSSKVAYIKFVVNKDYIYTKTFDNVEYSGNFTHGTNLDNIIFYTKRQTSETIKSENIDYREDTYKFAIPRNNIEFTEAEKIANKTYKDRMKGKYLICSYKYDCNNGNTFKIPYINTIYRYSMI